MEVDLFALSARERYAWMISSVVPRPIALVSTLSSAGVANLAPFSFFNGVTASPPIISLAISSKRHGVLKDTVRNVRGSGELVVNVVSESMAEPMVLCSGEWEPEESEFALSGLTPLASKLVEPPRVAESPLSMECRLMQIVPVGEPEVSLILAEVVLLHVDERILTNGLPDPAKLRPLARLGGSGYAQLGELLEIQRPDVGRGK